MLRWHCVCSLGRSCGAFLASCSGFRSRRFTPLPSCTPPPAPRFVRAGKGRRRPLPLRRLAPWSVCSLIRSTPMILSQPILAAEPPSLRAWPRGLGVLQKEPSRRAGREGAALGAGTGCAWEAAQDFTGENVLGERAKQARCFSPVSSDTALDFCGAGARLGGCLVLASVSGSRQGHGGAPQPRQSPRLPSRRGRRVPAPRHRGALQVVTGGTRRAWVLLLLQRLFPGGLAASVCPAVQGLFHQRDREIWKP